MLRYNCWESFFRGKGQSVSLQKHGGRPCIYERIHTRVVSHQLGVLEKGVEKSGLTWSRTRDLALIRRAL